MATPEDVSFALVINHTPWRPERVRALASMMSALDPLHDTRVSDVWVNDVDWRGFDWQAHGKVEWLRDQLKWAAEAKGATHAVFMTDDLHIAPEFWAILSAMVAGSGARAIGLLSNHWLGPQLYRAGRTAYRAAAWMVGPAMCFDVALVRDFRAYFEARADGDPKVPGTKGYANDDSTWNEYLTKHGIPSWHPLPTIVEHRGDLDSTVGHGDRYSRERVSWRLWQRPYDTAGGGFEWRTQALGGDAFIRGQVEQMTVPKYWAGEAPMLLVQDEPKGRTE